MYADVGKFHLDVARADRESCVRRSPAMRTGTQFSGAALGGDGAVVVDELPLPTLHPALPAA